MAEKKSKQGKKNKKFQITGRVIDSNTKKGIPGLRVEAWDKDLIFDDFIGRTVTDKNGKFIIEFTESHFKDIFLDRRPDLFFKIFEKKKLIKSTEDSILWNVKDTEKQIIVELSGRQPIKVIKLERTNLKIKTKELNKLAVENKSYIKAKLDDHLKKEILKCFSKGSDELKEALDKLKIDYIKAEGSDLFTYIEKYLMPQLQLPPGLKKEQDKIVSRIPDNIKVTQLLHLDLSLEENPLFVKEVQVAKISELAIIADLNESGTNYLIDKGIGPELTDENIWNMVVEDGVIPENKINDLKLTFELFNLTGENFELIALLKNRTLKQLGNKKIESMKDFIILDKNDWSTIFQDNKIEAPENTTLEEYAENLVYNIERTFPSEFLFYRIAIKDKTETIKLIDSIQPLFENNKVIFTKNGIATLKWKGISASKKANIKEALKNLSKFVNTYKHLGMAEIVNRQDINIDKKKKAIKQEVNNLNTFYENNPALDLRYADFIDDADYSNGVSNGPQIIVWNDIQEKERPKIRKQLMAYQRVLNISKDFDTMSTLLANGYDSAYSIITLTEKQFIRKSGLSTRNAQIVYNKVLDMGIQTAHGLQLAQDIVWGSFGDLQVANINSSVINDLKKIDGYQELFGSQNYCDCVHCRSIFGPAAYFVDLMYFIEKNVSEDVFITPGRENHPLYLKNRRPDLWDLKLTCENTNNLISYLDISNEIIEKYIIRAEECENVDQVYQILSGENKSFNQPFNLPLIELRTYLEHFSLGLADVFSVLKENNENIAREKLNISKGEFEIITRPDIAGIEERFGNPESNNEMDVQYFLKYAGITREELDIIIKFKFLNAGVNGDNIAIIKEQDPEEIQNFTEKIINLNKTRLDRIHRFIRLWGKLPWSSEELNLVLSSLFDSGNANTLNAEAVKYISALKSIQDKLEISVEELCGLWTLIPEKPIHERESLFDRLFKSLFSNGDEPVIFYHNYFDSSPSDPERIDENMPVLLAGLAVSESDLLKLLIYLKEDLGINNEGEFILSKENLSLLYRYAKLSKALKISIEDCLYLVSMALKLPEKLNTIENILKVIDFMEWLQKTPNTIAWLWEILNEDKQVKSLIKKIQADKVLVLKNTELGVIEGVSEVDSKKIISKLKNEGYLTQWISSDTFKLTNNYRVDLELEDILKDLDISESAKEKMGEIRDGLNSFHPITILQDYLTESLNINSETYQLLIELFNIDLSDSMYIDALNYTQDDDNQGGIEILNTLFAFQSLCEKLELKEPSLRFISEHPEIFGIDSDMLDIGNISLITDYSRLLNMKEDSEANVHQILTGYSPMIDFTDEAHESLAYVLETEKELILSIINTLKINDEHLSKNPIENVFHIMCCLEICNTLGVNARSLYQLTKTEFDELLKGRDTVYGAFRARYESEEEWNRISEPFANRIRNEKRDALNDYILSRSSELRFEDKNDLYNYFLIDTEMEGCAKISKIKAAISSLQLYIHRCLISLEQSASDDVKVLPTQIPSEEWEWRRNYRVWEANRKVFLYPENWIEPELRDNKTPIFEELEEELFQQKITLEAAENAYKTYMDKFIEVANLKIAGSYYDEDSSDVRTLYLFGRIVSEPLQYYYRRYIETKTYIPGMWTLKQWTPWIKIDLTINSEAVSPIVHRNKLYVFWVEINTSAVTDIDGGSSDFKGYRHKINLKYAHLKSNNKWSIPTTIKLIEIIDELDSNNIPYYGNTRHDEPQDDYTLSGFEWERIYPFIDRWDNICFYYKGLEGVYLFEDGNYFNSIDHYHKKIVPKYETDEYLDWYADILTRTLYSLRDNSTYLIKSYNFWSKSFKQYHLATKDVEEHEENYGYLIGSSHIKPVICPINAHLEHYQRVRGGEYIVEIGGDNLLITRDTNNEVYLRGVRVGTTVIENIDKILHRYGLSAFLSTDTQKNNPEYSSPIDIDIYSTIYFSLYRDPRNIDFNGACGNYYRELYFHIPFIIANHLNADQGFKDAQEWYHYIFNPTANEDPEADKPSDRNWRYVIFRGLDVPKIKEILTDNVSIEMYKRDPFNPHAIARLRPCAYQKAIVMKYIDNLLDWGDSLFAQDTYESINEATMLYVMAADILGKRPVKLGKCEMVLEEQMSYNTIAPSVEEGSEFLIMMENYIQNAFALRRMQNNILMPTNILSSRDISLKDKSTIIKSANQVMHYKEVNIKKGETEVLAESVQDYYTAYSFNRSLLQQSKMVFCVPHNNNLLAYWDRVEDRLFKIRNCMNIKGIRRELSLFQPPIDPGLLVKAKAAGLSIEDIIASLSEEVPPYRFVYLIEKAKSFTASIQGFGSALLSALEKKDVEELTLLRSVHEQNILKLTKDIKKKQIKEAEAQLESLKESKVNVENRIKHYDGLIKQGLIKPEKVQQISRHTATTLRSIEASFRVVDSIAYLVPNCGSPFAMTFGGREVGKSVEAWADLLKNGAIIADAIASSAGLEATFDRRKQDWEFQLKLAEQELAQTEKQITASEVRLEIAEKDYDIHIRSIEQSKELYDFYKDKFTNLGLYNYLASNLNRLYRQAYNLAYDMAKMAEKTYQFERDDDTLFIQNDNWNVEKSGLLAGERLMLQLQQMDKAYVENNTRDYEVNQSFSLAQLDPQGIINLRESGGYEFEIPEIWFDLFYPGQFKRVIKSVRLTIPCVTGPYTNVSCKLTLIDSAVRKEPKLDIDLTHIPHQKLTSVATSSANNDGGVFELNFRDERYMPFEGAGAISRWKLELPNKLRNFDYDTISDVIIHISYTAKDDGQFREKVESEIENIINQYASEHGLQRFISAKHEFSNEWAKFLDPAGEEALPILELDLNESQFPYIFRDKEITLNTAHFFLKLKEGSEYDDYDDESPLSFEFKKEEDSESYECEFKKAGSPVNELPYGKLEGINGSLGKWSLEVTGLGIALESIENILIVFEYSVDLSE